MKKIAYITDSTFIDKGLHFDLEDVFVLPIQVIVNGQSKAENIEISCEDVIASLKKDDELTTSLPSPLVVEETLTKIQEAGYEHIFLVIISEALSGTKQLITTTAQRLGITLKEIETYSAANTNYCCIQYMKQLFATGKTVEEVTDLAHQFITNTNSMVIIEKFDRLMKSGRVPKAVGLMAGLFGIKALLFLNKSTGGKIEPKGKARSYRKIFQMVLELIPQNQKTGIYICHADNLALAEELQNYLQENLGQENINCYIRRITPAISLHSGLGSIVVQLIPEYA